MENVNEEAVNYHQSRLALSKALVAFIAETKDVHADSTNPFHKNKYASLSAHLTSIKPIAAKHGLAIIQLPVGESDAIGIQTIVIHKDGGSIESTALIPCDKGLKGQEAGAIYSYLRRYALAAVAGVATEDDDAEMDRVAKTGIIPASKPSAPSAAPAAAKSVPAGEVDGIVPFGKNKGSKLSELDDYNLGWWANTWEPKPWEKTGKVGAKDLAFKAAAVKLWNDRQTKNPVEDVIDEITDDEVPF